MERADGSCEFMNFPFCTGRAEHLHHRKISGRQHTVENVVHICQSCHEWTHQNPKISYEQGWLVKMNHDPADTPMKYRGRLALLGADGLIHYQEVR